MKKAVFFLAAAMIGLAASAQQTTVFAETFENVSVDEQGVSLTLPTGWTNYGDNLENNSRYSSSVLGKSWFVAQNFFNSGKCAGSISWTDQATPCDRWLVTPSITLPQGRNTLLFTFYGSQYNERFLVLVSTATNAKEDFTDTLVVDYPATSGMKMFDLDEYAGQTIHVAFINNTTDGLAMAIDDVMVLNNMNDNGAEMLGAMCDRYITPGNSTNIYAVIENTGHEPMTSVTIEYTVGTNAPETRNITGISVAPFSYYVDTLTTTYSTVGSVPVDIVMTSVNGDANFVGTETSTQTVFAVYNPADAAQREAALLEHFTTAQCQFCPGGHRSLAASVTGIEDKVVWVAHHVGFGTDAMTLDESEQIANAFSVSGAPQIMINRDINYTLVDEGEEPTVSGYIGNEAYDKDRLQRAAAEPAFATIHIGNINFDESSRQLSIEVSGSLAIETAEIPNVTVWITEDSIIGAQVERSGNSQIHHTDYQHDHVLRGLVTPIWGDAEAISSNAKGTTFSKTYTYTVPASWKINKCRVVAFVNDMGNTATSRTILAATKSGFLHAGSQNSIASVEPSVEVSAYPNPAAEKAVITAGATIRGIEVVNTLGQTVMVDNSLNCDFVELNVADMEAGVYFVTVRTDGGNATERLVVK